MKTATLVGPSLGLEVIEHEYTVGPTRPGLDGLGLISQQNYWLTARSGGQNGLGYEAGSRISQWMRGEHMPISIDAVASSGSCSDAPHRVFLVMGGALAVGLLGGFFLGRR